MTNEKLNTILDNINHSFYKKENYSLKTIDENIDIININDIECIDTNHQKFRDFFLIKNDDSKSTEKYIGIVLDMVDDLHFFVLPKFRGKSYLKKTLDNSILPFLSRYKYRENQRLSFQNSELKEYFIKCFQFQSIGDKEVEKKLSDESVKPYTGGDGKEIISHEQIKQKMISNLNDAILKIKMLNIQTNSFDYDESYDDDLYWEIKDNITFGKN